MSSGIVDPRTTPETSTVEPELTLPDEKADYIDVGEGQGGGKPRGTTRIHGHTNSATSPVSLPRGSPNPLGSSPGPDRPAPPRLASEPGRRPTSRRDRPPGEPR